MDLRSLQLYRSEVRTSNHERLDLRGPRVSGLERRRRAAEQRNTRRRREAAEQSLAARTQAVARKKRIRTSRAKALNRIKDCGDSGNATPQALQLAKRPRSKRRSIKPLLVLSGIFASKLTKRSDSERRQALQDAGKRAPVYLMRAYGCEGQRRTNGFSSETLFLPAADWNRLEVAASLCAMDEHRAGLMLGKHILWEDRGSDEFDSWTLSLLFGVMHGYRCRYMG
ncbi:hypothetical protein BDV97DRAFT_399183 [Delphinella strobiligena]|nr:hypothetical protein BDV97DRAFT_399183 [Delphinella strobiligena]